MLNYAQAIILGLLQGAAELFPISSLGHSSILPALLHWQIDQGSDAFLSFVVATHFATALVLLAFFWEDWMRIIVALFRSLAQRRISSDDTYAKLGWLIVVGTIPAGLLGLLFEKTFKTLIGAPELVAGVLVANGIVLYAAEALRRHAPEGRASDAKIAHLTWAQAVGVGCAQAFALIPGLSRTGLAMTGGLLGGLSHENAARYAFLLATPIIAAAAVLKIPDLFAAGGSELSTALVGAVAAAISAYLSVRYLTHYFQTRTLKPFAVYCVIAGLLSLAILIG